MMSAGEKEIVLASEETTRRNVKAAVAHGNETRQLFRELEAKVTKLEEHIRLQNKNIDELRLQLVNVQAKVYSMGGDP